MTEDDPKGVAGRMCDAVGRGRKAQLTAIAEHYIACRKIGIEDG